MRVSHKSWAVFLQISTLEFNDSDTSWFLQSPLSVTFSWFLWLLTEVIYKVLGQGLWLGGDGEDRHFVTSDGATQGLSPEEDLGLVQVLLPESQMCLSKIYR